MDDQTSPHEALRAVRRRALALAQERRDGPSAETLEARVACLPGQTGGGWEAVVTVHLGDRCLLRASARAESPSAALLALPGTLEEQIEAARERLKLSLAPASDDEIYEPEADKRPTSGRRTPDDRKVPSALPPAVHVRRSRRKQEDT